eukprot:6179042-Pleurochrysis_carterae.AAC.6
MPTRLFLPASLYVRPTRYYLPTYLCPQRVSVWAPSKLVTKVSRDSATGRYWTNGQLVGLRGKIAVTSHLVPFT